MQTLIGKDLEKAKEILEAGGLVAIPTETVYGLAASAFNTDAIAEIYSVKKRPYFDPLILHIGRMEQLGELSIEIPPAAALLAKEFWPGPLTLILKKSKAVPDLASSGLDTVGIRMPHHPLSLELLRAIDFPLAAPSANPFGYVSPTTAQHVVDQLNSTIPYVLDGGACKVGLESTIVSFSGDIPTVLRKGGLEIESIEALIGRVNVATQSSSRPSAPGMLISHYATRKPLYFGDIKKLIEAHKNTSFGVLGFQSTYSFKGEVLSAQGDLREAAGNLFAAMRRMDSGDYRLILAEALPEKGLGMAINDRLRRAASLDLGPEK